LRRAGFDPPAVLSNSVIDSFRRTRVVTQRPDYVHAEFRSFLFRFCDDVEFYFDDETERVHLRSASRLGYSDLGVNRRRMTEFARRYRAAATTP